MKRLPIILSLLLAVGCMNKSPYSPHMLAIEQLAGHNANAALRQLDARKDSATTRADSMLYVLLYSETARSNGMTFTNDSWIEPAVTFFDSIGDKQRTARAMLMLALCYYDEGQYDDAAVWLMRTREQDVDQQPQLQLRLYLALGDLNDITGRTEEKIKDYMTAYHAARACDDNDMEAKALYKLAIAYYETGQPDSMQPIVSHLKKAGGKSDDIQACAHTAAGMYAMQRHDTTTALNEFVHAQPYEPECRAASLAAGIMYRQGNAETAKDMWLMASNSSNRDIAIDALAHLLDVSGNIESDKYNFRVSRMLNDLYADKPSAEVVSKVVEVQKRFDEEANEEQSQHKITLLIIAVSILVLIVICSATAAAYRARRKKRAKASWNIERELLDTPTSQHLHQLAATGRSSKPEDWTALNELIVSHDTALVGLLARHKSLTEADKHLIQLIRLRFQPSEIAVLMQMSPQRVTNTRSRMLVRLFNTKGGAKDFDRRIREL